jgi:hypothetical protein
MSSRLSNDRLDRLPPLWLSASALTAALVFAFAVQRWIAHFVSDPFSEDFRLYYVSARIGLTYGWSHIYDLDLERQVASIYGPVDGVIGSHNNFVTPPPVAWLVAPLTVFPLPAAFVIWTLVSLAALILAWWLVCPGKGLARITLLLIAIAIWPMHYSFWQGQTEAITVLSLAATWWLLKRERWALAGAAMAVGLFIKPQLVFLLPVALFLSGRRRPALYFALVAGIIGVITLASLGSYGIASYQNSVNFTKDDPLHSVMTYGFLFGRGPVATGVEVAAGLIALSLAWYRRDRLDLVFALAIVGCTASAFYLHEVDPAALIVPAWIVLGSRPSLPQRVWLLVGIVAAQLISIGLPTPMLLWEAGWIGMLGIEPWLAARSRPMPLVPPRTVRT